MGETTHFRIVCVCLCHFVQASDDEVREIRVSRESGMDVVEGGGAQVEE